MKQCRIETHLNENRKARREEFSGITHGTIIAIDPGTKYLGWSVVHVSKEGEATLVDRGTIVRTLTGTASTAKMIDELNAIIDQHRPDELVIEDYLLLRGKTNGVFAVPAIIGIIKYEWYRHTGKEAITVKPPTWKSVICRTANAQKLHVREALREFLEADEYEAIVKEFAEKRGKHVGDRGEQDCIDAVAIGLYVCIMVLEEQRKALTTL